MDWNIALFLKSKRKELNLKVSEVVSSLKLYGIEISEKTLYGYETGHRQPDADTFLSLCKIYEIESLSEVPNYAENNFSESDPNLEYIIKCYKDMNQEGKSQLVTTARVLKRCGEFDKHSNIPLAVNEKSPPPDQ